LLSSWSHFFGLRLDLGFALTANLVALVRATGSSNRMRSLRFTIPHPNKASLQRRVPAADGGIRGAVPGFMQSSCRRLWGGWCRPIEMVTGVGRIGGDTASAGLFLARLLVN